MAGKNLCAKSFYFPLNYITLKLRNNLSHVQYSCAINKQQFYGTNSCIHCSKNQFMQNSYQISFCENIIDPNFKKNKVLICNSQNLKQGVKKNQAIAPFLFKCDYLPIIEMETLPCLSSKSNLQSFDAFKCSLFCKNLSKTDQANDLEERDKKMKLKVIAEEICDEIPKLLSASKNWHNFSKYTKNIQLNIITYKTNINEDKSKNFSPSTKTFKGLKTYKIILNVFRMWYRSYLSNPSLEVVCWNIEPKENMIEIRWRVIGSAPLDVISSIIFRMPTGCKYFDYISSIYVNEEGFIWKHNIENVVKINDLSPQPLWSSALSDIITNKSRIRV